MHRFLQSIEVLVFIRQVSSQSHEDIVEIKNHPFCYHKNFQYTPDIEGTNIKVKDMMACKSRCKEMPDCVKFAFFPFTNDCYFGPWYAHLVESKSDGIAGYGECPAESSIAQAMCKTDTPHDGFPGLTNNASMRAWPSGRQPWNMECWPKDWKNGYQACSAITVLEDTDQSWPGKCRRLERVEGIKYKPDDPSTEKLCEENCRQNPLCASWQTGFYGDCWQGVGEDCFVRDDFHPVRAQRLQHGEVRVLMDLTGWQIVGLYKVFDNLARYFTLDTEAAGACKRICYSDIRCQYWLYTPKYGCYVENVEREYHPPYPLTLDWAYRDTDFALDSIAGEFIQHSCLPSETTVYPTTPAPPLRSCMEVGYQYRVTHYYFVQGDQYEQSANDCQARCAGEYQCGYFTYWPDGTCYLAGPDAERELAADFRVIAGPAHCKPTTETTTTPLAGIAPIAAADNAHPMAGAAAAIAVSAAAGTSAAAAVDQGAANVDASGTLTPAEKSWLTDEGKAALGVTAADDAAIVAGHDTTVPPPTPATPTQPAAASWLTNEGASAIGVTTTPGPEPTPAPTEPLQDVASRSWLTPEGQQALGDNPGGVVATNPAVEAHADANPSRVAMTGTPSADHIQIVQMLVTIRGLSYDALSEAEVTTLSEQYAAVIAKGINEPLTKIMDKPLDNGGRPGRVMLQSQPPSSSQIVAYAPNDPPTSLDTSVLAGKLYSPVLAAALVATSKQYASTAAYATTGPLAAANQMVTMHHHMPNPEADLSGTTGGSGGLSGAWPMILAGGLLLCGCAIVVSVCRNKSQGSSTRGVNMEDTQTSFLSSEYHSDSDMDGGDPAVWASEPVWEDTPKPPPPPPRSGGGYGNGNFTV